VALTYGASGRFSDSGEGFGQYIIEYLVVLKSGFKLSGLGT
jgi:hypothetical protein